MSRKRKIFFFTAAIFLSLLTISCFYNLSSRGFDLDLISFDEGWTVHYKDTTVKFVNISNYHIDADLKNGDTVVYKKRLNIDVLPLSTLRFKTFHAVVSVYLNDEIIYEYGHELYNEGLMVGSGVHFVNLPENVDRRMVTIKLIITERAESRTNTMVEIVSNNVVSDYFSRHALSSGVGIFLCLFGIIAVIFSLTALAYYRSFYRLLLIGAISLSMGTWTLCYMKVIQMFSMDFAFNSTLEYLSLYVVSIPICLLLVNMRMGRLTYWKKKGLLLCTLFGAAFFVVTTVLHFTNLLHYPQTLHIFHGYIVLVVVYIAFARILRDRMSRLQDKILIYGLTLFIFFASVDLIRHMLQWELSFLDTNVDVTLLPVGTLIFVILLMVSYIVYLYDIIMDKTEKEMLKQIAFRDSLTGLYNRAKCKRIFEVLDRMDSCYAIVSLDLNGLKHTNDTFGHSIGDSLIVNFADVLKKAFHGVGTSIRMGGDEFVVIVRAEHLKELGAALDDLKCLEKDFVSDLPIKLDAAYGYAIHQEGDETKAMEVYKLADKKMYEMKVSSKKSQKE